MNRRNHLINQLQNYNNMFGFSVLNFKITLCIILISKYSVAFEKYWLPDLEWQTANNWANGRIPEIDSRVIFPPQTQHAVGIAKADNLRLSGIDLPNQGLLVLPRNGKLQLSNSRVDAKVSKWSKEGNLFWADPANWNGSSIAAPHLERVPCRQDDVVLPSVNRTLSVLLPVREVFVKSIRLSNEKQPFFEEEWIDFEDRREFSRGRFTVKYSELYLAMQDCPKCFCQGNSLSDYLEEICAIQRPRCGFTDCEYPLTVEGHCCPYCGGRVSAKFIHTSDVSLAMVQTAADEALEGHAEKIAWHTRRTWNGGVEVLVKEKGDYSGIVIQEAVENLKEMLQTIGHVTIAETAGAAMKDSRLAVTLGPLLGTPLVAIVFLLLIFLYYDYSLEHVLSGCMEAVSSVRDGIRADKPKHGFARFENVPEGNVRIADVPGTSEREVDDNDVVKGMTQVAGGRFENPLYRSKRDRTEEEILDAPLSLATLKSQMDDLENKEMDTEE